MLHHLWGRTLVGSGGSVFLSAYEKHQQTDPSHSLPVPDEPPCLWRCDSRGPSALFPKVQTKKVVLISVLNENQKTPSLGFTLAQHAILENLLSRRPGSSSARLGTWIFVADPNILALWGLHSNYCIGSTYSSTFSYWKNPTATAVFLFFEGEPFQWKPLRTCSQRTLCQVLLPLDRGRAFGSAGDAAVTWLSRLCRAVTAFLPSVTNTTSLGATCQLSCFWKGKRT